MDPFKRAMTKGSARVSVPGVDRGDHTLSVATCPSRCTCVKVVSPGFGVLHRNGRPGALEPEPVLERGGLAGKAGDRRRPAGQALAQGPPLARGDGRDGTG